MIFVYTKAASWIAEAGKYTVKVGASSIDIQSHSPFNVAKDIVVEKVSNQLIPKVPINELKKLNINR